MSGHYVTTYNNPDVRRGAIEDYYAGRTIKYICNEHKISNTTLYKYLKRANADPNRQNRSGGYTQKPQRPAQKTNDNGLNAVLKDMINKSSRIVENETVTDYLA
jgi:hypothetical protein